MHYLRLPQPLRSALYRLTFHLMRAIAVQRRK
jgi:hypothetical protein